MVPEGPADAVVVGLTRTFTYDGVARAAAAVRGGARFIGTNEDPTFPTPDGLVPGAGAILAAVATAGERTPEVAGKPHRPTADAIAGLVPAGELRVMVGDRPSTDGRAGGPAGHSLRPGPLGGHPGRAVPGDAGPAAVAPDLLALVRARPRRVRHEVLASS